MEKERWQARAAKLLFAVLLLFIIYVILKYAFGVILPFLAGIIIAVPIAALSSRSAKYFGGSRKLWGVFYIGVFWLFLFVAILLGVQKLLLEAEEMLAFFGEHISRISERLGNFFGALSAIPSRLPFLEKLEADPDISGQVSDLLNNVTEKGSEMIASLAGRIAVGTPRAFAGFSVSVISSFYFCKDLDEIKNYIFKFLSNDSKSDTKKVVLSIYGGIKSYGRAYLWLFLITFAELFVGLIVLRRQYALVVALLIAVIDLLPLLGAGIILVPWAVILIADGALGIGIGMLVLFALVSVVRQIVEPRLVGKELGIHPLASLAAMYIGFRIFGFVGMLTAPIGIVVIREILSQRAE